MGAIAAGFGYGRPDAASSRPIALHPANPNIFLFRGRPTVLVASGEHYGALVNLDFDYVRYLDALKRFGFNVTRVFTGSYVEHRDSQALGHENTLAPRPERFLAPWARAGGEAGDGRFDLTRWNEDYFARLRSLVREAGRRGIVVELTLFSVYYDERTWRTSPLHVSNNVNGVGARTYQRVYEVAGNARLLAVQEALVRRLVRELRAYDNVIFEVLNEPWAGPCDYVDPRCGLRRWQDRIISLVWETERDDRRHLISEDVGHGVTAFHGARNLKHARPNPRVSVLQYHAAPPAAALLNLASRRAIGDNETGSLGLDERPYRTEAWLFLLSGGALFNSLDWGFTTSDETGGSDLFREAFISLGNRAGSGGPTLQSQISFLQRFLRRFPLVRMRPRPELVTGRFPAGHRPAVLADPGRNYAVYLPRGPVSNLRLRLPAGSYRLTWVDPVDGRTLRTDLVRHSGGTRRLEPPVFAEDLALAVARSG